MCVCSCKFRYTCMYMHVEVGHGALGAANPCFGDRVSSWELGSLIRTGWPVSELRDILPCLPLQCWNHKPVLSHAAFSQGFWGLSPGPPACMRSPLSTESRSLLRKTFLASDFLPFHIPHRYFQYNQVRFPLTLFIVIINNYIQFKNKTQD